MNRQSEQIWHERKSPRLKGYDYSIPAYYFVTICTLNRIDLFGEVKGPVIMLNECGKILEECWLDLPNHYINCELDYYSIMPNHFHGIIIINERRDGSVTHPNKKIHGLSEIVRGLKTFSSKRINQHCTEKPFRWQKSFYDRIIRNEKELYKIRRYIQQNSINWEIENSAVENLDV